MSSAGVNSRSRGRQTSVVSKGLLLGASAAMAALLAACGSSTHKVTNTPATGSAQPSSSFSTATVSGLGPVLVDGRGKTLYILTTGGHTNVPCTDSSGCTKVWPDLPLAAGATGAHAGNGVQASLLGTMKLSDGHTYPTYNGWLLYEFAGDPGPGHASGQGIHSFGGTWYVLNPAGNPVTTPAGGAAGGPSTSKPATSSGKGGGGYGY